MVSKQEQVLLDLHVAYLLVKKKIFRWEGAISSVVLDRSNIRSQSPFIFTQKHSWFESIRIPNRSKIKDQISPFDLPQIIQNPILH